MGLSFFCGVDANRFGTGLVRVSVGCFCRSLQRSAPLSPSDRVPGSLSNQPQMDEASLQVPVGCAVGPDTDGLRLEVARPGWLIDQTHHVGRLVLAGSLQRPLQQQVARRDLRMRLMEPHLENTQRAADVQTELTGDCMSTMPQKIDDAGVQRTKLLHQAAVETEHAGAAVDG